MSKYQKLDELIVARISGASGVAVTLAFLGNDAWNEARSIEDTKRGESPGQRTIDRRLQALRKGGKIRYSWELKNIGWVPA